MSELLNTAKPLLDAAAEPRIADAALVMGGIEALCAHWAKAVKRPMTKIQYAHAYNDVVAVLRGTGWTITEETLAAVWNELGCEGLNGDQLTQPIADAAMVERCAKVARKMMLDGGTCGEPLCDRVAREQAVAVLRAAGFEVRE